MVGSIQRVYEYIIVASMGLSTIRIISLATLGLVILAMTVFIFKCCCRTYQRLHRRHTVESEPLLDNEASVSTSEYGTAPFDYNETLERARVVYQPTPFTQAQSLEQGQAPPRYEDLYGSVTQPYNNVPSFLLDDG